jgi:hypothetical protein
MDRTILRLVFGRFKRACRLPHICGMTQRRFPKINVDAITGMRQGDLRHRFQAQSGSFHVIHCFAVERSRHPYPSPDVDTLWEFYQRRHGRPAFRKFPFHNSPLNKAVKLYLSLAQRMGAKPYGSNNNLVSIRNHVPNINCEVWDLLH